MRNDVLRRLSRPDAAVCVLYLSCWLWRLSKSGPMLSVYLSVEAEREGVALSAARKRPRLQVNSVIV